MCPTTASSEDLHKIRIEATKLQMKLAQIDSNLDNEIKKEKLKQEKIKTRILLLELRIKKKLFRTMQND